jgi:hypothetical protein
MIKVKCKCVERGMRGDRPCTIVRCYFDHLQAELTALGPLSIGKIADALTGATDKPVVTLPEAPIKISVDGDQRIIIASEIGLTKFSHGLVRIHLYVYDSNIDYGWLTGKQLELHSVATVDCRL